MPHTYNLDMDLLPNLIEPLKEHLGDSIGDIKLSHETHDSQRVLTLHKGKQKGVLIIYIKAGGKNTFQIQGNDHLKSNCSKCKDYIINEISIEITDKKSFTITNVPAEDFEVLIEFLKDEDFVVEEKENPKPYAIKSFIHIKSKYKEVVTITYFINGTLLAQGVKSRLLANLITYITDALSTDIDVTEQQKQFFEIDNAQYDLIDTDLKKHIPTNYDKIEGKITTILKNSLLHLNHPLILSDYSSCVFPALRALEGTLKKVMDFGIIGEDSIGGVFSKK